MLPLGTERDLWLAPGNVVNAEITGKQYGQECSQSKQNP